MMGKYILKNKIPVVCNDVLEWGKFMGGGDGLVGLEKKDGVKVSTVFLGLDRRFGDGGGEPVLFETMIFGGDYDHGCERYCTWEEAVSGHKQACEKAFNKPAN